MNKSRKRRTRLFLLRVRWQIEMSRRAEWGRRYMPFGDWLELPF